MKMYVLAGWVFKDFAHDVYFYNGEVHGMLQTADEPYDAKSFPYDKAEKLREHLQKNYSDYGWYLLRLNSK